MQHLNYCRQMLKQFSASIGIPNFDPGARQVLSHAIDLANASEKFLLPEGGRLYDDPEYKALDDGEELRLPFPLIALEYSRSGNATRGEGAKSTKAIIFARERNDAIVVLPVFWIDHMGMWAPLPEAAIPRRQYLARGEQRVGGYTAFKIWRADPRIPLEDYSDEFGTLLCFLNVLQCKNVHTERSDPKKPGQKVKGALPFDSYHVLTIEPHASSGATGAGVNSRSPREHLRRGHIRRLSDGRRIWVNATVVAAGRGAGIVAKDYAIKASS